MTRELGDFQWDQDSRWFQVGSAGHRRLMKLKVAVICGHRLAQNARSQVTVCRVDSEVVSRAGEVVMVVVDASGAVVVVETSVVGAGESFRGGHHCRDFCVTQMNSAVGFAYIVLACRRGLWHTHTSHE